MALFSNGYLISVLSFSVLLLGLPTFVLAEPHRLWTRASSDNTVLVEGRDKYCLIVPRDPYTDIGNSEYPGGTTTYCSASARWDSSSQGLFPDGFWTYVEYRSGTGPKGGRVGQLTGCINPSVVDRFNVSDRGGQYDSTGGIGGKGNPEGSICRGYKHYVELIEPAGPRACIRCCDDEADCPTNKDTLGCPQVVPGNYFSCA